MSKNTQVIIAGLVGVLIGFAAAFSFGIKVATEEPTVPRAMPVGEMPMNHDMHSVMEGMSAGLQGKTGDAFDKAFLDEMIVHHEGALDMAQQVLEVSDREELRKLANEIIAAQTTEIEQMSAWRKSWFK